MPVLTEEQINYYYDHPVEFFEDILKKTPTSQQIKILNKIPKAIKNKKYISVKSGHSWYWQKFLTRRSYHLVFIYTL